MNLQSLVTVSKCERYCFEKIDICNRQELDRFFLQYQLNSIIHLAAESHVDRSIASSPVFIKTNIIGTYILLEVTYYYWNM